MVVFQGCVWGGIVGVLLAAVTDSWLLLMQTVRGTAPKIWEPDWSPFAAPRTADSADEGRFDPRPPPGGARRAGRDIDRRTAVGDRYPAAMDDFEGFDAAGHRGARPAASPRCCRQDYEDIEPGHSTGVAPGQKNRPRAKKKPSVTRCYGRLSRSGRQDSNLRPSEPHSDALARLRHAPIGRCPLSPGGNSAVKYRRLGPTWQLLSPREKSPLFRPLAKTARRTYNQCPPAVTPRPFFCR